MVKNNPIGKLFRTAGFILVLVASFFLAVLALRDLTFLTKIIKPVVDFVDSINFSVYKYVYSCLIIGLGLLLWTQNRSYFLRILITLIGIASLCVLGISGNEASSNTFILFFDITKIQFLNKLVTDLVAKFKWLPMVSAIVPVFLVYLVLSFKKPERISTSLVSSGVLILVLAIIGSFLPSLVTATWVTSNIFTQIVAGAFGLSYLIAIVGSIFGVFGMFRR